MRSGWKSNSRSSCSPSLTNRFSIQYLKIMLNAGGCTANSLAGVSSLMRMDLTFDIENGFRNRQRNGDCRSGHEIPIRRRAC